MSDDSVYDDEIDLRAASNRLLSQALQQAFDEIISKEGMGAPNAIGRALKIVTARAGANPTDKDQN